MAIRNSCNFLFLFYFYFTSQVKRAIMTNVMITMEREERFKNKIRYPGLRGEKTVSLGISQRKNHESKLSIMGGVKKTVSLEISRG